MVLSVEYFILIFSSEVAFYCGCNDYICNKALFFGYSRKAMPQQKKISVWIGAEKNHIEKPSCSEQIYLVGLWDSTDKT